MGVGVRPASSRASVSSVSVSARTASPASLSNRDDSVVDGGMRAMVLLAALRSKLARFSRSADSIN